MKLLGGGSRRRRLGLRDLAAASTLAVGVVALSSGVAFAAPTPFTWSGGGGDNVWSDGANWVGGSAPQPKTSAALTFPILPCGSGCDSSAQNDVTQLKVPSVSVALGAETGNGDYNITGNGIKIGTLDVTSSAPNGSGEQGAFLGLPMTLLGSETWSVDIENGSNFNLGTVAGASSDSLTVNVPVTTPGNAGGFLDFPSVDTGPLTFQGSGATTFITGGGFNGTSGQAVKFLDTGLFVTGPGGSTKKTTTTNYGPLTAKGADIFFGNGSGGPFGIDSVNGNASLDSATSLSFNSLEPGTGAKPTPGVNYPQLAASGTVKLGSANLGLFAGCTEAIGTKYTIVTGSAIKGTFNGIANGDIVQSAGDNSPGCQVAGATSAFLQVAYSATTVTATVVAAPPAAALAHASVASHATPHLLPGGALKLEG
jgi:hypothetical protein